MNIKLIWFWILLAGTNIWFTFLFYPEHSKLTLVLFGPFGVFSLIMVFEIIRKHKDFKLVKTKIIVKQIFRTVRTYELSILKSWTVEYFVYRSHQKRTLKMKFTDGRNLEVTDLDNLNEYEKLYHHLRVHHKQTSIQ